MKAARGRQEADWDRTAAIMAHMVNTNPFRGKAPLVQPDQFNPFRRARRKAEAKLSPKQSIDFLARMFGAI